MSPNKGLAIEIRKTLSRYKYAFVAVACFSGVLNLLMLLPSMYMMQVYDRVLTSKSEMTLTMLTVIIVVLFIMTSALDNIRSMILIRISAGIDVALSKSLFHASFLKSLSTNNVAPSQAFTDLANIRQFITGSGLFAILDIPWIPVYVLFSFFFNESLGFFTLIGLVVISFLAVLNEVLTKSKITDANKYFNEASSSANKTLQNAEVIKALGMYENLQKKWERLQMSMLVLQASASIRNSILGSLTKFIRTSWQSLVLGLGALLVIEHQISGGMMIACSIIMGKALAPLEQTIASWKQLTTARVSYERVNKLLIDYSSRNDLLELLPPKGAISVENLSVMPPDGKRFGLKNVSFDLDVGEFLAVIGPSASGKSTLVRAILGVWPVKNGHVKIDDANIQHWDSEKLGRYLGYLPQDIELFDGTIADNIARFSDFSSPDVIHAAMDAGIHEMILSFESGYNTHISHGGLGLSGGQRQRVGLARAIYKSPRVIVLDEPNSNLDEKGEAALYQTLVKLKKNRSTVIIVTHKANLLSIADKILLLEDGQTKFFGSREQFVEKLSMQRTA